MYALPSVPVTVTWVAPVATTVRLDEPPRPIESGLTAIVTVGSEAVVTVTVAVADAFPRAPFATAVYVVVAFGLTGMVPPCGCRLYTVPSDPLTVTCVAFVAVTVRVEELPGLIEAGVAVMPTSGDVRLKWIPHPVISKGRKEESAAKVNIWRSDRETFTFVTLISFLPFKGAG